MAETLEPRLKHRVVGAITLVGIAIITLPMLLDGTEKEREQIIASIPAAPDITVNRISVSQIRERMDAMERASAARLPVEVDDEDEYDGEQPPLLDKNQLPTAWSVQLASFQDQDNAVKLRQALRADEYHSYILHARTSAGETYRVLVGPLLDRVAINVLQAELAERYQLDGRVVRYQVEDDVGQLGGDA